MEEFLAKIASRKEDAGIDLSTAEDLSIAVMNLISLEEHFFFTGVKLGEDKYFETSNEIREVRKDLLRTLMPHHKGETWCITKHLLATTMRLIEVGTKLQSENKKDEAKDIFAKAYKMYSIFWALKLELVTGEHIKTMSKKSATLEDLVSKLADCCDE